MRSGRRLRIAAATFVTAVVFLLAGAAFAVSDGHFDVERQGCEPGDYTYDQKDVDHPGDGCETITVQAGPAEEKDFARAGVDHEKEGVGPHAGAVKLGRSESNADDSERVLTIHWNTGYAVTGPRTLSPGGPPMIERVDDPAVTPAVRPENAGTWIPEQPLEWSHYFGMDDNWIFGEHHSTSQAANDASGEPYGPMATGPVSGGGWSVDARPDTENPEANADPTDRRRPVRAAGAVSGFCADGICMSITTEERTVYQGGDTHAEDRPAYVWSGNPPNGDGECDFWSPTPECRRRRDDQGRVYVPAGVNFYQDPDPAAPERFGPKLWEYPMPSTHVGGEGVRVLDQPILELRPNAAVARPLVIGHRGTGTNTADNPYPENTLASIAHALDGEGADGVEIDVVLSLDGELVLMHDESLNRTTTCDDPTPLNDCVLARTADDIRANCIPVNGDGATEVAGLFARQTVPLLSEVLEAVVVGRGKYLNIEIKNQPPTDSDSQREGCTSGEPANLSSALTNLLLSELTEAERSLVFISSFNPFAATAAKHEATALGAPVDTALLAIPLRDVADERLPDATYAAATAKALGLDGIHPHFLDATPEAIAFARELGLAVRPWTVNERCEMRRLIDVGVDAIITDEPDRMVEELAAPSSCS